jgi:hypothetical protein
VTGSTGGASYRCQVPGRRHSWADSSSYRQAARASRLLSAFISLPRWIFEITRHPRPASLESASDVETVHPLVGWSMTMVRRVHDPDR